MTQRTELQHRMREAKVIVMTWVASKVFTFRQTGLDGFIKRRILPQDGAARPDLSD